MGWTIGIPSLKLSTTKNKSKHCGNFYNVAAEALKERIGRDPDINPELSSANIYYGFTTAKELVNYSESHCATLKDAKGRALRSDAVKMCVTLIKPPAAFMATLVREEQIQFLNDGITKLKQIVGEDNVKSVAIHFDEQGPHAHVFWEPMTKDGRLCSKEVHNLQFFGRLKASSACSALILRAECAEELPTRRMKSIRRKISLPTMSLNSTVLMSVTKLS